MIAYPRQQRPFDRRRWDLDPTLSHRIDIWSTSIRGTCSTIFSNTSGLGDNSWVPIDPFNACSALAHFLNELWLTANGSYETNCKEWILNRNASFSFNNMHPTMSFALSIHVNPGHSGPRCHQDTHASRWGAIFVMNWLSERLRITKKDTLSH